MRPRVQIPGPRPFFEFRFNRPPNVNDTTGVALQLFYSIVESSRVGKDWFPYLNLFSTARRVQADPRLMGIEVESTVVNRDARSHVVQSAVRRRDRRLPASSSSNPDAGAITAARRARTKRSR